MPLGWSNPFGTYHVGDVIDVLRTLPGESVQCVVTSPPYWALRSYLPADHPDKAAELGSESTPEAYVARMVEVFREVRRVLRADGTAWVNLGDSYAGGKQGQDSFGDPSSGLNNGRSGVGNKTGERQITAARKPPPGLKPKDLVGIPWRVAFALRADGWWLRSPIVWYKPNPMPESVTDRPTKSYEHVFLLTKRADYFYDAEAIAEPVSQTPGANAWRRIFDPSKQHKELEMKAQGVKGGNDGHRDGGASTRNARDVWTIATAPYKEAHFATFPPELVRRCVLAGTSERGCCPTCGGAVGEGGETCGRRH